MNPMKPSNDAPATPGDSSARKPRLAFAIATALGTGYLKPGPGTWGSLVGVIDCRAVASLYWFVFVGAGLDMSLQCQGALTLRFVGRFHPPRAFCAVWFLLAYLWESEAARGGPVCWNKRSAIRRDRRSLWSPSRAHARPRPAQHSRDVLPLLRCRGRYALYTGMSLLNWKYLLAGFLLFRLFDIAKPFPCRRLEKLPGGWGIMADDWMAGIYAAICLRLALHFHLL